MNKLILNKKILKKTILKWITISFMHDKITPLFMGGQKK